MRAADPDDDLRAMLEQIQRDLFAIGARLADPAHRIAARVDEGGGRAGGHRQARGLDRRARSELPPLRRFILAGGSRAARRCTSRARSAAARSERWSALGPDAFEPELLTYVNRLSDLLFVMARAANHRAGAPELEW